MGTVKYTGSMASFHCPTNATIRSLKVHFSPKQSGTGDPSPENVREIVGWDGVKVQQNNVNLLNIGTVSFNGYKKFDLDVTLPAGTYYVYAKTTSSDTDAQKCLISFYNKNSSVGQRTFNRGVYEGGTVTLNNVATTVYIYASNSYASSIGDSATFENVQLRTQPSTLPYESCVSEITDYEFGTLGKNKFDITSLTADGIEVVNGVATGTGSAFNRAWRSSGTKWIDFTAPLNQQITVSFKAYTDGNQSTEDTTGLVVYIDYTNGTKSTLYVKNSETTETYHSIISDAGKSVLHVSFSYGASGGNIWHVSELQIEYGSEATAYEPYNPNHTVYGGWVDLISGEVCEEWCKIVADGVNIKANNGSYVHQDRFGAGIVYCTPAGIKYDNTSKPVKCDTLPVNPAGYGVVPDIDNLQAPYAGQLYVVFYVGKVSEHPEITTNAQRADFVNAWLQEHPTSIAYKLVTPNTYYVSPTQLSTFLGQNNVWSNADYIEIEYDLHETQTILQRKQYIMANQPHIVTPANAQLQSFTTDLVTPLKECKVYFNPVQEGTGDPSPSNVRPISGWTGVEATRTGKSIVPFLVESKYSQTNYNGFAGWSNAWKVPNRNAKYTYSVYIDNTNSTDIARASVWFRNEDNTSYVDSTSLNGTIIQAGSAGISCLTVDMSSRPNTYYLCFGMKINNATASQPFVEYGDVQTEYEAYNDMIIPVEFPIIKNLLPNKTYVRSSTSIYVGQDTPNEFPVHFVEGTTYTISFKHDGTKTAQVYFNEIDDPTTSVLFGTKMTCSYTAIKTNDVRIFVYVPGGLSQVTNFMLEVGSSATEYEPYKTVYGGYVDLVTGEVYSKYRKLTLANLTWHNYSSHKSHYIGIGSNPRPSNGMVFCNTLKPIANTINPGETGIGYFTNENYRNNLYVYKSEAVSTDEEFRAWFSETYPDAYVVYELETPVLVTTLTSTQLKTLRGTNNIWSNSNDLIELKYWTH